MKTNMPQTAFQKIIDVLSKTNIDEISIQQEDVYYKEKLGLLLQHYSGIEAKDKKKIAENVKTNLCACIGCKSDKINGAKATKLINIIKSIDSCVNLLEKDADFCNNANCESLKTVLVAIRENAISLAKGAGTMPMDTYDERLKRGLPEISQALTKDLIELTKKQEGQISSIKAENKVAEELKNQAESIVSHALTIIGIFTAIIIAVVACYLTYILSELDELKADIDVVPLFMRLPKLLVFGCIILMIIFFLLYLTAKLTNRSIACQSKNCPASDCSKCDNSASCGNVRRFWRRYPYITAIFTIIVVLFGVWMLIA